MIETAGRPEPSLAIEMRLQQDDLPDLHVRFIGDIGYLVDEARGSAVVRDSHYAIGDVIEVRLPLRTGGLVPQIVDLCLTSVDHVFDCMDESIAPPNADELAPNPVLFPPGSISAIVRPGESSNIRSGPGLNFSTIGSAAPGTLLNVAGRDESADWLKIEIGRFTGWIALSRINLLGNAQELNVVG
jgi:hypothetical protein